VEFILPTDPKRPPPADREGRPTATVGPDGTFAIEVVPCTADTPGADQDGTRYIIGAVTPTQDPLARPRAAARAAFTVGPVAQIPDPILTLTPDRGACNSPVIFRGAHFPPGATVAFSAFPDRSDSGVRFGRATVEADGTFAAEVEMRLATNCNSFYPVPVGARYQVSASVDAGHGRSSNIGASTTYTIAEERLTRRCFAPTGHCVSGRFLEHWELRGLPINGYPIGDELVERLEDGREYTVQYFERVRLEHHPENRSPYDVLLGQFGRRLHPADPPVSSREAESTPAEPVVYVPETGHNLCGRFLSYWELNGGLEQFGFPIGEEIEEQLEDGDVYTVQYFERARFEHHPENAPPYDVLLGQFGRQILTESGR
jgi:hypothetical protein